MRYRDTKYGRKILKINQDRGWHRDCWLLFKIPHKMLDFLLTSLIRYNEQSPISKKIKALYHFWGRNNKNEKYNFIRGWNDSGRTGKWAKRLRGERESGRNDPGAKRLGAKGKVGETTQGRTGKWAKRLRGERESGRNDPDSFRTMW